MLDRAVDPLKGLLGEYAVVTEALDFEQRRLARKPISRSLGKLCNRLPMAKSSVLLIVVSVRRARSSL
jgi:hypothetical protein